MALVAKMQCDKVVEHGGRIYEQVSEQAGYREAGRGIVRQEVFLSAVYAEDGPNKEWAQATPVGKLELTIDNQSAFGFLEPGAEYFVRITKVRGKGDMAEAIAGHSPLAD